MANHKTAYTPLDERDWCEVYNTLQVPCFDNGAWERANKRLNDVLGVDGKNVRPEKLTPRRLLKFAAAVEEKGKAIAAGEYDFYNGEIDEEDSETREWADQMARIAATLRQMAASGEYPARRKATARR